MKLKTKLVIAFMTVILVPVLLISFFMCIVSHFQMNRIRETYNIEADIGEIVANSSIQIFTALSGQIQEAIQVQLDRDPDQFEDVDFLRTENGKLMGKYSYLIVRKNDEILFDGHSGKIPGLRAEDLPSYEDPSSMMLSGRQMVRGQYFKFSDGGEGSVFIVTAINEMIPEMRSLAMEMVISMILVLVITAAILTTWIYRSLLRPIGRLREATRKIAEGNLDFTLDVQENDEIGQLCTDFEGMRQRLKETVEERMQFDTENKELISNISHDLKTPITAIKGYVEGIMDGVADTPEKMDRYIRTIYNKANDMDRLIDELTFYSKIDANKIPYTFNKINVTEYFLDCAEELEVDLAADDIEFGYFNYCDEDVTVIADAEQLKRVVNNIVSNSVKYMDKSKGKVNLRIKDVGDFIQVEIEDNGKGIAQRDLPNIFERFYRTDSSRNSSKGGSGIGLSIVRKIIEDHGGRIWATSKEGVGTVMYFVLRKYQEVRYE